MNKKMVLVIVLIAIVLMISANIYVVKKRSGRKPKGERLTRIINSDNYQNGIFQNTDETNMERPPMDGIKEMMKSKPDQKPSLPIHTEAIDLNKYKNFLGEEVLISWLGHSTILMKMNNVTIIADPVFSKRASMFEFIGPKKFDFTCEYSLQDLPQIDVVLITHDHYDHLDYQAIKFLNKTAKKFIVPLGVGAHLEHWGVDSSRIMECDWWEEAAFMGLTFTATPGRHFSGRLISDRFKTLWCGWALKSANHNLYLSGDSGYFGGFKEIGERLGPFDFSFMECGQYSKYWPYIHMMPEESVQAAIDVKSKIAMPIHWGKFKLSIHSLYEPPTRFARKADEVGLKISTPKIGQTFSLKELPTGAWWN